MKIGVPIGHRYEPVEVGQIKSIAAKISAKYHMTARWTGWADFGEFEMSNICARRIASAAKFYGTDFGVEAALYLDGKTASHALFEALSNSAGLMHNDPGNIMRGMDTYKMLKNVENPGIYKCSTAVFYPIEGEQCGIIGDMEQFYREIAILRRSFDYEIADSLMIADGFLENIDTLIFAGKMPVLSETCDIIMRYVKERGLKLLCMSCDMPYVIDAKEERFLDCDLVGKEILENEVACYRTEFSDRTLVFDAEKGSISEIR